MADTTNFRTARDGSAGAARTLHKTGWSLGHPFGIPMVADYSLLLIFALIALNLGAGLLPAWHPQWPPWLHWAVASCAAVAFFASIALHELSHALVARAKGMSVRRIQLFIFGGVAEIEGEPPSARVEFWMAVVGPLVSIAIGLASSWLGAQATLARVDVADVTALPAALAQQAGPVATVLLWLGPVNLFLGVFNLVPGFPLDGGRVLRALIWWITGNLRTATRIASGVGQGFAWLLMATGMLMLFGRVFPVLGGGPLQGMWLLLIGWFLNNAARASFQQLVTQQALEDVRVRDVMRSRVDTVAPSLPIDRFVREVLMNGDQAAFPVLDDGKVVGLIRAREVRAVPRVQWHTTRVGDAMLPVARLHVIAPDDPAFEALRHLADHDPVPVVDHDRFVGVTRRDDVIKWLALHGPHPA